MIELSEHNVLAYLREKQRVSAQGEVLVQSLSGGVANVVLKIMDMNAGEPVGTDMRTPGQIKRGIPDKRMRSGACFVIKQPLEEFRTAALWVVDRDRVWLERDALIMLKDQLPIDSIPSVLWSDEENCIIAISVAPVGATNWKQELLAGRVDRKAATAAAEILALMHSTTMDDVKWPNRFGQPRTFIQQRIDPYLRYVADRHPHVAKPLQCVEDLLLKSPKCFIHGDYSPKNMLWQPEAEDRHSIMFVLDFEVAFFGNPVFDAATLINHLLLKAFHLGKRWRAAMIATDDFWQTYRECAGKKLALESEDHGGKVLSALMLARMDGKSPVEYITDETQKQTIRQCAMEFLLSSENSMDAAVDHVADYLDRINH